MKYIFAAFIFTLSIQSCKTKTVATRPSNCDLAPDPGPCRAAIVKYYSDKQSGTCQEFIYGGCQGVVPFETKEECEKCKSAKK
jgi:hypothetical protein